MNLLDPDGTLANFKELRKAVANLPKPKRERTIIEIGEELRSVAAQLSAVCGMNAERAFQQLQSSLSAFLPTMLDAAVMVAEILDTRPWWRRWLDTLEDLWWRIRYRE